MTSTPAAVTCPTCRRIIGVREAPSGIHRIERHTRDGEPPTVSRSCPATGREIPT